MNKKQLVNLGVPKDCVSAAIAAIQTLPRTRENAKKLIPKVVDAPEVWVADPDVGEFAKALIEFRENDLSLIHI